MLVDSGASAHFVDENFIPGLRQRIRGLRIMDKSKLIETAGYKKIIATATGTICERINNLSGEPMPVCIFAYLVR